MKADRMTLIESRQKANTPAKVSKTAVAKSSVGAKALGILHN